MKTIYLLSVRLVWMLVIVLLKFLYNHYLYDIKEIQREEREWEL